MLDSYAFNNSRKALDFGQNFSAVNVITFHSGLNLSSTIRARWRG
jgi:hypothetical protein